MYLSADALWPAVRLHFLVRDRQHFMCPYVNRQHGSNTSFETSDTLYGFVPQCVIVLTTAQLQTVSDDITLMYSICVGIHACAHLPVIIPFTLAVSNEALAAWRMLCNHANQHLTRSQQGYYR